MQLKVVNTGSHGNCYVLESKGRNVLLDLGVRWKGVLTAIDYDLSAIDFALVTHSHG